MIDVERVPPTPLVLSSPIVYRCFRPAAPWQRAQCEAPSGLMHADRVIFKRIDSAKRDAAAAIDEDRASSIIIFICRDTKLI